MPTLTVEGLPEELRARLKERASCHSRGKSSAAITICQAARTEQRPGADEMIRRAEALGERVDASFDADLIENGKREGRP
jgi:plasmid stability protein